MSRGRRASRQRAKDERDQQDSAEASEEDTEEPVEDVGTRTSIDDITQDADFNDFGQTYLAEKQSFQIGGAINSPAPFPLEVIPRLAYTINYNVVYDEERERWVPQKKSNPLGGEVVDQGTETLAGGERIVTASFIDAEDLPPDLLLPVVGLAEDSTGNSIQIQESTQISPSTGIGYAIELGSTSNVYKLILNNFETFSIEVNYKVYRLPGP